MLFNSYEFLLVFLPIVLAGFRLLGGLATWRGLLWLALASFAFYGWGRPAFLPLLVGSIAFNWLACVEIARHAGTRRTRARGVLAFAIAFNLLLLGYFKYTGFVLENVAALTGVTTDYAGPGLPIGISFFTFTQIALLVDLYRETARAPGALQYGLFVSYFPHLVAGPVIYHGEMLPQFARAQDPRAVWQDMAAGLTLFTLGMAKKVLLADAIAPTSDQAFAAAAAGAPLGALEAWAGALAYTMQLYFDFSGYCDMASGLSLMLGVRLPLNFYSPYRATSPVDFWRRWHITLSRFLRAYLYVPLGGNRRGAARRYANIGITMLLGGLWHGAGWTFLAWGAWHGLGICLTHAWRALGGAAPRIPRLAAIALTFLFVVLGWVLFRAPDLPAAFALYAAMVGAGGPGSAGAEWIGIGVLLALVWCFPNTEQLMAPYRPTLGAAVPEPGPLARLRWRPTLAAACATGLVLGLTVALLKRNSPFLYFEF